MYVCVHICICLYLYICASVYTHILRVFLASVKKIPELCCSNFTACQAEQQLSPLDDMLFVTTPDPCQFLSFQ